ncbi:peptide deformylase, partial [Evtepia gabavorous]
MIRKILQKEDPALHKVCHPVTSFDRKLGALLDDLTATLKDAQGLGLAAPQIGILRRVCVVMDEDEQYLE